jgi:hypothetical protein
MINFLKTIWYSYNLNEGLKTYQKKKITTQSAYSSLRKMFILSRGISNDKISKMINEKVGKYELSEITGVLGDITKSDLIKMIEKMKVDGFYIFDTKLSDSLIEELYNTAMSTPCRYLDINTNSYSENDVIFNPNNPISPRYEFDNSLIVNIPVVQKLLFDKSLLCFAQEYLGVKPILDLVAFWWSVPFSGKGKSAAAQMYHFDMDRIKFMKFFFYVTDVDTNNGPHCFVRGSHKNLPKSLARDGRFTDEEIEKVYGAKELIEISGSKGSIIAVDTRGFHKGKELLKGKRLIFQIEFANSMFGQNYPPLKIKYHNTEFKNQAEKYAYTYKQFLVD